MSATFMSDIRDDTRSGFTQIFGYEPHGLWSAPGELTLLGDDSDYADGYVLSIAIDRRTVVAAGVRKDRKLRVASTEADEIAEISLDNLEPEQIHGWAAYPLGVAWALGQFGADLSAVPGLDIFVDSDVPVGVGLGSSAALETAIAVALNDAWQLSLDTLSLAKVCQRAEKSVVGHNSGLGDHIPTLAGEDDRAVLFDSRSLDSDPVALGFADHNLVIVVMDTGVERAKDIESVRFTEREEAVDLLGVPSLRDISAKKLPDHRSQLSETTYRRVQHIVNENQRVLDAARTLKNEGPLLVGDILTASQASLRDDYDASGPEIDLAIDIALTNGAIGARMIGLGNSGTLYALVALDDLSLLQVALDGGFSEHGFSAPATYVVRPSRGALRH
jgi:galactokinase